MKLLVTGGAGFIGSNFVRFWLRNHVGDVVITYDALTYAGCRDSLVDVDAEYGARHIFVKGDIRDYDTNLRTIKQHTPDVIVNFAAESHNSRAIMNPGIFTETNVIGTQRLLEAARVAGVDRFHHISTCEVYGDLPLETDEKFTEESPYRPNTPYNASKAAADMVCRAYQHTFGLPVTISNCSNNYGPYQFPEKIIPLFTIKALSHEKMPLYRSSRNKREWIHVDDHCRGIEAVLLKGFAGQTYNIGTGVEVDIETIADLIVSVLGLDSSYKEYVQDRPGHDRRYLLDSSKITQQLGWKPRVDFNDGLKNTIRWYQEHEAWWKPLLKRAAVAEDHWNTFV